MDQLGSQPTSRQILHLMTDRVPVPRMVSSHVGNGVCDGGTDSGCHHPGSLVPIPLPRPTVHPDGFEDSSLETRLGGVSHPVI